MIGASQLTKRYRDHLAVDDLSFEAEPGEILGLLGPNGAGKTTTLRMLTGALSPTSGTVRIGGHDLFEEPLLARARVGYLPETPPVHPDLRVEETLRHAAALRGLAGGEARAALEASLERTALREVRRDLVATLSRGFRQRLGLAIALLGAPPVLVLDEPTLGLDPLQVVELRELIQSLAGDHTILLSSHILTEVEKVCDRVLVLKAGKVVAFDRLEVLSKAWEGEGGRPDLEALFRELTAA
ncbi:MAG: ABC transporter ATP-binding protein [Deltaproteobacteria bacterium]|nr:ABC transporter ATP-binding protein [Deltaproteobacteria bacterium]